MLKLIHYKNSLMFSDPITCSGIALKFKGKFIGESSLSDDWYVATGKRKIICISFTGNQQVSELFTFQGSFSIIGMKIVDQDLNVTSLVCEKLDIDYFNRSKEVFDTGGSYFADYNSTHESIKTSDDIDIYKNNLFTKENEFYLENGENYFGSYHQHSNGQAMSESEHTDDSVKIFRKDQNNKLYKPKPKRLRPISATDVIRPTRDVEKTYRLGGSQETAKEGGSDGGAGSGGSGGY